MSIEGVAFITGANGFIGRRLRDTLVEAGVNVVSLCRRESPKPDKGRSLVVDYADPATLEDAIEDEQPHWVFHLAGATKGVTYEDFQRANVLPTQNLLEALKRKSRRLQRFVHVSSLASFGPSSLGQPHEEGAPRNPIEHYGRSKLEAEQAVESVGDSLPWTILRPGGVYGPGDVDYFELFKSIARGMNVFFGNRNRAMSVVYVDDLVRAICDAAMSNTTRGQGYFICDGQPLSFGEFQQAIVEASGRRVRDINLPEFLVGLAAVGGELLTRIDGKPRLFNRQKAAMGKQPAWTCRHHAAQRDFGYTPAVPIQQGVSRTFEWYRTERWL